VDLKEKVAEVLRISFHPDEIRLEDEDGIYGYVVSNRFDGMNSLDRQELVDDVLRGSDAGLSRSELRHVLMIAAMTPAEYSIVGPNGEDEP
jgi:stress-induced morphogen